MSTGTPEQLGVNGEQISFSLPGMKGRLVGRVGDICGGWIVRFLGPRQAILEQADAGGGALFFWSEKKGATLVTKPRPGAYANPPGTKLYLGHTHDDVVTSLRDILGEAVLSRGEPSYEAVAGLLPPIHILRYQVLGGPLSRGKYLVLGDGTICTRERNLPTFVFSPSWIDSRTAQGTVYDGLLDDWMPAACYRIITGDSYYDLIAFVEYDDYRQIPTLWIALNRYCATDGSPEAGWYFRFTREWHQTRGRLETDLSAADFYAALAAFVADWRSFAAEQSPIHIPEARVSRWVLGCLARTASTFEGDHPKYGGARSYAEDFADTFPPTLHDTAEAFMLWGDLSRAKRYLDYGLRHIVRPDGTFNFRGPSGTEYGRWLWLLERAERQFGDDDWLVGYLDKLAATGEYLGSLRRPVLNDHYRLIYLGAEDDNRDCIHVYFSNNLWACRGLSALARILERHALQEAAQSIDREAQSLWADTQAVMQATAVDTEYGPVIPSFVGYPAPPWTLSIGPAMPDTVPADEAAAYTAARKHEPRFVADQEHYPRQWIRENTYANYRYYLEALSSGLLEPRYAQALTRLRQARGGEILGMTRIFTGIDDWPVQNYARYLLATDQIDRYLLLYYAHMAHHGNRETLTFYEHISADGRVITTDVVPCTLTIPLMTAWMLCFEPIGENALYLFRGVPCAWLANGRHVAFERLGTSAGSISGRIVLEARAIRVELDLPEEAAQYQVFVDLPIGEIARLALDAPLQVSDIRPTKRGYRLRLEPGSTGQVSLHLARL